MSYYHYWLFKKGVIMARKRKSHMATFKAQVALAAAKCDNLARIIPVTSRPSAWVGATTRADFPSRVAAR